MKRVVDASVAVKWYIPEIYESEADHLLQSGYEFHAPELILAEFSSIIWKKIRLGELTPALGQKVLNAFINADLILHSHRQVALSAFTGALMTGQTVYDWTYLSLALALSCEFVTADERFYNTLQTTSIRDHLIWIGDI
jgi:predicted nucleic acid-binding protein